MCGTAPYPPASLVTSRLLLRPQTETDLPLYRRIDEDPKVMWWREGVIPPEAETRTTHAHFLGVRAERGLGWWMVFARPAPPESDRFLGIAGLVPLRGTPEIQIGYHLLSTAWGHGYATEAARALLVHGFDDWDLAEIASVVLPNNLPSLRIMEKLGFAYKGMRPYMGFEHRYYRLARSGFRP